MNAPHTDAGSVSTELAVFVAPALVLLTVFVVFCGRTASAAIDVHTTRRTQLLQLIGVRTIPIAATATARAVQP